MIKLYNTLSRSVEEFRPLDPEKVRIYTCGPTVYHYAHIGNMRTYTAADFLIRTLRYNDYDVKYVMNLTDVGHLTGDNAGDADTGEDRMEKSAEKEGKSVWDVAKFYTDAFLKDYKALNLYQPMLFAKATDHIQEQIFLIQVLEKKGFTYKISDGIYFDTSKFPDYGKLSSLDQIKEGARVEVNPEKKNPRDFALWKFSPKGEKRQMEWESSWGVGFPGWHIECSAMSMKYLGETFDIHVGGIDLSSTHHPNEIAQSEAATGKPFVQYWMHGAFMLVNGTRMSKSLGNNYKLQDLAKRGYSPLVLRYLYLQTHYRQEMNFTFEALDAAQHALHKLWREIASFEKPKIGCAEYEERFNEAISDDINMPQALAVVWELIKSDSSPEEKVATLYKFDQVLGLDFRFAQEHLEEHKKRQKNIVIPEFVMDLVKERADLRRQKRYHLSDEVRHKIRKLGFDITDLKNGKTEVHVLEESEA